MPLPVDSPQPCATCAFGSAGAADEPNNRLKGLICALAGSAFFCHHLRDGTEYNWRGSNAHQIAVFFAIPRNERKVCEGWKRAVADLARRGHFTFADGRKVLRLYQKALGNQALDYLTVYLAEKPGPEKEWAHAQLSDTLRALKGEDAE